jgi:5'-nucleotidase
MNILLTNGGGHRAEGLAAMRRALIGAGFNVLTVAPAAPCHNMSRSVTNGGPIAMDRVDGDDRNPIFAVAGTPVDCIRIAILSGMAREVSLVVSGINEGANVGDNATYSSTLGAAVEGALLGYPSMAISQETGDGSADYSFEWCGVVGAELAAWMSASPPPDHSVLNVDAPASLADRHLKLTSIAHRIWNPADCEQTEIDGGSMVFSIPIDRNPQFEMTPGSDALAVAHGHVSITPVSLDFGQGRQFARLRNWTKATIAKAEPRLGASDGSCKAGCCG